MHFVLAAVVIFFLRKLRHSVVFQELASFFSQNEAYSTSVLELLCCKMLINKSVKQ